jgi:hypothetical protein
MRAHFHNMREVAGAPDDVDRRGKKLESQARTPAGAAYARGWGCGAQLTVRDMRAHFTICPKRPHPTS